MFDIIDSDLVGSRGHPLRIVKSHCRINVRLYSFVSRNINVWNTLPERLVRLKQIYYLSTEWLRCLFLLLHIVVIFLYLFSFFLGGGRYQCIFKIFFTP